MTDQDLRPRQQRMATSDGTGKWMWIVLGIAVAGYAGWYARTYWDKPAHAPASITRPVTPIAPPAAMEQAPVAPAPLQTLEPGPLYPLPDAAAPADTSAQPVLDVLARTWLGDQALQFLSMPGLAHHVVATVDNLPRAHAAVRLWPVFPVGGQMVLEGQGEAPMHIAARNSARYNVLVAFLTSVEPAQAAQWYREAYPQLQQAYEALGYPGQYFNDRLVAVIDHLLQTPHPQEPLAVRWVQVQGEVSAPQPWLRYEYVDPQLQSLSAGQRVLLRIGAAHRQRLTDYLRALRVHIVG